MGFFSSLFGSQKKTGLVARIRGRGSFEIDVVGESHYQGALEAITGGKTEDGHRLIREALLIPESGTLSDPMAVRVDIEGRTVGYLDRDNAREFRQRLKEAGADGYVAAVDSMIVGGWYRDDGDDKGSFGVKLDLPADEK